MKLWLCCSVLALGALGQKTWGPYPSITNKTFIKICVDVHNKYRREVNPPATDMRYMVCKGTEEGLDDGGGPLLPH